MRRRQEGGHWKIRWRYKGLLMCFAMLVVIALGNAPQASHADSSSRTLEKAEAGTSAATISVVDAFRVVQGLTWWGVDMALETMGYGEK